MKSLFFVIYDIIWLFLIGFSVPFYVFKKKFKLSVFLGRLSLAVSLRGNREGAIWIQAVSVGEVLAVRSLVEELKKKFPYRVVVSTTTVTGKEVADRVYRGKAYVISFPFDITLSVRRTIDIIRPKIFIAVETEFWPNLFYHLYKKRIPIVVLNGRISDKAYSRYRKVKFITKRMLSLCSYIGVQNDLYLKRFIMLGANSDTITISGNIKFANLSVDKIRIKEFQRKYAHLLRPKDKFLFIAASTHSKEEKIILDVYESLRSKIPLNLLLAPRHPERVEEVEREVRRKGIVPVRISAVAEDRNIIDTSVFILDTVGELFYFYHIADICFVGGSLFNYGGHNILEPLYFSKPTLFGPHMSNFKEIEEVVLKNKAALKVYNQRELECYVERIIFDDNLRNELVKNAMSIFKKQGELMKRNIEIISRYLS